jgi:hypothetical protein
MNPLENFHAEVIKFASGTGRSNERSQHFKNRCFVFPQKNGKNFSNNWILEIGTF